MCGDYLAKLELADTRHCQGSVNPYCNESAVIYIEVGWGGDPNANTQGGKDQHK